MTIPVRTPKRAPEKIRFTESKQICQKSSVDDSLIKSEKVSAGVGRIRELSTQPDAIFQMDIQKRTAKMTNMLFLILFTLFIYFQNRNHPQEAFLLLLWDLH